MAGVTKEQLKKEIAEILKNADLTVLSAKKVRQQLEEKLKCDLLSRKKEIDELVMNYVNSREKNNVSGSEDEESEDESDEEDEVSEEEPPTKKRAAPVRKPPAKRSKKHSSSEGDQSGSNDNVSDEEYSPSKSAAKSKKGGGAKKKNESDSDSDEDWKKPAVKKSKKGAASAGGGAKGKGTGFTRALTLSPELAALMGAESLPRHEVVKKMWAMIKERNLYDPKNKQYAICDNDLIKVIGVKRFRTFGMLKYLRQHFID